MIDANELMRRLRMQSGDPQTQAVLERLQNVMQTAGADNLKNAIDNDTATRIERAAKAAQSGDKSAAQAAISEIMSTPEGAALAAQLKRILGQ